MKSFAAVLALAGAVAALPQAVTSAIAPAASAPAGCKSSYSGTFEITVVNVTSPAKRAALELTLANGILKDAEGRTGYIASNYQFQFDGPPQAGAIYTAGWTVCANGSIALGDSAIFYQCLSGTFYNLYDQSTGAQCSPVYIDVIGGGSSASVASDGQPTVASQQTDGQVTETPVSQISDGQIQATTGAVSQISDGQPQAPTGAVSQISDGQPQAPTATPAPVSQISDGQPQATTGAVSQISDGQPQAPTGVVSQISDGQPQAPTATPAPVSQISDGQPQAPTSTGAVVSQISDGQPQAPTNGTSPSSATASVQPFTGAAALPTARAELFALAGGLLALAAL